ncbi:MAG: hypothetical protein IKV57_05240 [Clostridia bacterium]|nr:hypothetical protein [Clostridia bacterium]
MNKTKRLTVLFLALICCLPLAVACGKKGGISVDKNAAMEQMQISNAKTQESKDAEAESKKQAMIEGKKNPTVETKPPETEPIETKGPVEIVPIDDWSEYSAPPKTPDVYNPDTDNRTLKIHGAAVSDGDFCVAYGECAVGATVTVKTEWGTSSVVSEGGVFAIRFENPDGTAIMDVTQTYEGKQIGDTLHWEGEVVVPNYGQDWGVWIGGENQSFYYKNIPDFEHTNLMSDKVVADVTARYADRVEKLKTIDDGCELIYLMIPAAMTVYPELVPEEVATPGAGQSRFDQLAEALTNAGATVIDMRETFSERKNDALPLYCNNDSHWADYGAYIAYVELFDYISDRYPEAAPRKFDEFKWEWDYYTRGDMPWYNDLDQGGKIYEYCCVRSLNFDAHPAVRALTRYPKKWSLAWSEHSSEIQNGNNYNTHRDELPDVMVLRNSYGVYMYDMIVERSDKAFMMPTFSYAFNFAQIKKNAPDYVIYILTEWDFHQIIDN